MKKAAILSLTAFYLLLSTDMYVCLMHCGMADMMKPAITKVEQPSSKMAMDDMPCCQKKAAKPAKKTTDGCEKHTNFTVKENLKPAVSFDIAQQVGLPIAAQHVYQNATSLATNTIRTCAYEPSPPYPSGRAYLIRIQSFLI